MTRSKQQALMFLLGAVLVGGALGFSADRVLGSDAAKHWAGRTRMYDDLALTQEQRSRMDSLLDDRNCQINAVMKPVRTQLDSIKDVAHQQMLQILTPEQQSRLEARRREMQVRDSIEKVRRDSIRAASNTKPTVCR
jgi:Spy/CpxP family protein refolding chaperone